MKPQVGLKKHKTAKSPARLTKEKTHITIIRNKRGLYYTSYEKKFLKDYKDNITHTMKYYSAIKKNAILPFAATWLEVEKWCK